MEFKPRQMVAVAKPEPKNWPGYCAPYPEVGTKGMVVNSCRGQRCDPPRGRIAVRFKAVDLGFLPSDDPDRRFLVLFLTPKMIAKR